MSRLLMIAHRIETLLECDRVIVMDAGCVIEDGDPRLLVLESGSRFASMLRQSPATEDPENSC